MNTGYKPEQYNSLSPYLVIDGAEKLIELLKTVFEAKELRRFNNPEGTIAHAELKIDDSVIMLSNSTSSYPPNTTMLHVYVPDVFRTFKIAIENGCEAIEEPINKEGDPDIRGAFLDFAGNYWAVSTQVA